MHPSTYSRAWPIRLRLFYKRGFLHWKIYTLLAHCTCTAYPSFLPKMTLIKFPVLRFSSQRPKPRLQCVISSHGQMKRYHILCYIFEFLLSPWGFIITFYHSLELFFIYFYYNTCSTIHSFFYWYSINFREFKIK